AIVGLWFSRHRTEVYTRRPVPRFCESILTFTIQGRKSTYTQGPVGRYNVASRTSCRQGRSYGFRQCSRCRPARHIRQCFRGTSPPVVRAKIFCAVSPPAS